MKIHSAIFLMISAACGAASSAPFTEPQAHPISRYEAGWQKNPFTLKTAPPEIPKESFAKDLALASWWQAGDDVVIRVVNTKTREYMRFKNQEPAPDGTKVKTAHLVDRRADSFVELERNNEPSATVRYDEGFLHTMGAQAASAKPNPQVATRAPNVSGQGVPPGMNMNSAAGSQPPPATAPNITPPGIPAGRPSIVPPVPNLPATLTGGSPATNLPTIQRRRLNTLPQPPVQR